MARTGIPAEQDPEPIVETTPAAESKATKPVEFATEALIKSKVFSLYQQDFLRALLPKPSYTMQEARHIVAEYFKEGGK